MPDPSRQHRASRDHLDWDERTDWNRSEQAASRPGAIDAGEVGKKTAIPPKWDGKEAERIVEQLERVLAHM